MVFSRAKKVYKNCDTLLKHQMKCKRLYVLLKKIIVFLIPSTPAIADDPRDRVLVSVIARVRNSGVREIFFLNLIYRRGSHVCSFPLTQVPFSNPLFFHNQISQQVCVFLSIHCYSRIFQRFENVFLKVIRS